MDDLISRQAAIDAVNSLIDRFERILSDIRESRVDDSVCGLCEYDGAYMGQSGDWCNECPGFDKDDCFKLSDECRKRWLESVELTSAQPEQRKGEWIDEGFYADGHGAHAFRCSECGGHIIECDADPFCRWCGADMRGEQDE